MSEEFAVEYLQKVGRYERIIQNKLIEIEQWRALAESITVVLNPDKVQSSGSKQRMAEAVEKYITIQEELTEYIAHLYEVKREVLATIEQLEPVNYDILHKIYIQRKDFQAVADAYDKSKNWVYKQHTIALEELLNKITQK